SGVAIANPNSEPAVVSFTFTDENGNDVYSNSATIGANEQVAAFLNETPFYGPAAFSGSFTFTSTKAVAALALRGVANERSDFLMTTLPVVDLSSKSSTSAAVFPHFADGGGWTSNIMLVNPTDGAISGTLRFTDSTGSPVSSMNYSIPAKSARRFASGGLGPYVAGRAAYVVAAQNHHAPGGSVVFFCFQSRHRVTDARVGDLPPGTA